MKKILLVIILSASMMMNLSGSGRNKTAVRYDIVPDTYNILEFSIYRNNMEPVIFSTALKGDTLYADFSNWEKFAGSVYDRTGTLYPSIMELDTYKIFFTLFGMSEETGKYAERVIYDKRIRIPEKEWRTELECGATVVCNYYKVTGFFFESPSSDFFPYCSLCYFNEAEDSVKVDRTVAAIYIIRADSVPDFRILPENRK